METLFFAPVFVVLMLILRKLLTGTPLNDAEQQVLQLWNAQAAIAASLSGIVRDADELTIEGLVALLTRDDHTQARHLLVGAVPHVRDGGGGGAIYWSADQQMVWQTAAPQPTDDTLPLESRIAVVAPGLLENAAFVTAGAAAAAAAAAAANA